MDNEKDKKTTLSFAPGCFDDFEGSQEELAELIAHIQKLADSGELLEESHEIDVDEMIENGEEELLDKLAVAFSSIDNADARKLH